MHEILNHYISFPRYLIKHCFFNLKRAAPLQKGAFRRLNLGDCHFKPLGQRGKGRRHLQMAAGRTSRDKNALKKEGNKLEINTLMNSSI
jgi:hypothetical protein